MTNDVAVASKAGVLVAPIGKVAFIKFCVCFSVWGNVILASRNPAANICSSSEDLGLL